MSNHEYKQIQMVNSEEFVLHNSQTQVTATASRYYEGELIKIKARFLEPVMFTPDHLIFVNVVNKLMDGRHKQVYGLGLTDWKEAQNVIPWSDYVVVPKDQNSNQKTIHLNFGMPCDVKGRVHSKIHGVIELNEDIAELFGWYVSEGCPSACGVVFNMARSETENINHVCNLIKTMNHKPYIKSYESTTRIWFSSGTFRDFVIREFGEGARNKKVAPFMFNTLKNMKKAFLKGIIKGDGHLYLRKNRHHITISSASHQLTKQLQLLLLSIGTVSGISPQKPRTGQIDGREIKGGWQWTLQYLDGKHKQQLYLEDENNFYFPVARYERIQYKGLVHDLTTTSSSFRVPFLVHNCTFPAQYTMGFQEAFMCGLPVVAIGRTLAGFNIEVPSLIVNGVNGFTSDSFDELRNYVSMLLEDYELAKRISVEGRKTAIELFSKEKIKGEWETFFSSL